MKRRKRKKGIKQCGDNKITKHHIVPQSRQGQRPIIALVKWGDHKAYHQLFGNMKPEEILRYLVVYFWGGDYQYIIDFYNQHIKGGVR